MELTVSEISRAFPSKLKRSLPLLTEEGIHSAGEQLRNLLRFLERAAFADDAVERYPLDSAEVERALTDSGSFLEQLERRLNEEQARLQELSTEGGRQRKTAR